MSLCVDCGGDGFCEDDCPRYRQADAYVILEWSTPKLRASQLVPLCCIDRTVSSFSEEPHMEAFTFYVPQGARPEDVTQLVEAYLGAW